MFANQKPKIYFPNHQSSQLNTPSQLLLCSINRSHKSFSTSHAFYFVQNIESAIRNKNSKLRTFINDESCNREQQHIAKLYTHQDSQNSLKQLSEYYKFYTQTTILYLPQFFKTMHENREKKKVVEYNRLKKLLDLSETTENSDLQNTHNCSPLPSFHFVSMLNNTLKNGQETLLFAALKDKLNKALGPNHYNSIDEIDKDYYFQHRIRDKLPNFQKNFAKKKGFKGITEEKDTKKSTIDQKAKRFKRNNSCESLNHESSKRIQSQHKALGKKKHQSMDNLSQLKLQTSETPLKRKKVDCWFSKSKQNHVVCQPKQTKMRIREGRTKYTLFDEEQLKQTIKGVKQKIRKDKFSLKKKLTGFSSQSELTASSKKSAANPGLKFGNHHTRPLNFHFS